MQQTLGECIYSNSISFDSANRLECNSAKNCCETNDWCKKKDKQQQQIRKLKCERFQSNSNDLIKRHLFRSCQCVYLCLYHGLYDAYGIVCTKYMRNEHFSTNRIFEFRLNLCSSCKMYLYMDLTIHHSFAGAKRKSKREWIRNCKRNGCRIFFLFYDV